MTIYNTRADNRHHRTFPLVPVRDAAGHQRMAHQITCSECGSRANRQRTNAFADDLFRKIGWHVGNNDRNDRCPNCLAHKQRKVVSMEDHRKQKPTPEREKPMSREDARIVWRAIEEHWNESAGAYKPGWSDARIADDLSAPVAWVETVRERDYGGSGDDPGLKQLLDQQKALVAEAGALQGILDDMAERLDKYRDGHRILLDQISRLQGEVNAVAQPRKAG